MLAIEQNMTTYLIIGILILIISFALAFYILRKVGKDPRNILPVNFAHKIRIPLLIFLASLLAQIAVISDIFIFETTNTIVGHVSVIGIILSIAWFLILLFKVVKKRMLKKYDVGSSDNLKARKVYTQYMILENIVIFIIVILAIGIALMSFESIRSIGVSVLTSAGIAGIIIGLAAQKAIGTLLAGIQIAITQPIRLDDVVIVEGEWGWIEEINLTYVVVRVWDKRRLVVPTTYFIEKTFQNWTRNSADILGTVFLYVDYELPVDAIRKEQTRLLNSTDLWDGKVDVLQVTNTTEKSVELRVLVSAKNSPTAWDLRVYLREKLLDFIQKNYPESLPKARISINKEPED
ncbi:small-conductance mechanosensitive channel [Christiangramia gaetbulicola]|uniref:Small-conductance mechanosensitive channel n=1 Tax=Christiangramia gaetbulicola TaxID=703340 RepID=A0A2T6AHP4_9FLAO|nr:mechanosensitive ion channel domain-containing protein [Christiangramia gaetbulicola]PTX43334.1 small-conductance mechanosensitive channel [Christiangramia gaetbulicola]